MLWMERQHSKPKSNFTMDIMRTYNDEVAPKVMLTN